MHSGVKFGLELCVGAVRTPCWRDPRVKIPRVVHGYSCAGYHGSRYNWIDTGRQSCFRSRYAFPVAKQVARLAYAASCSLALSSATPLSFIYISKVNQAQARLVIHEVPAVSYSLLPLLRRMCLWLVASLSVSAVPMAQSQIQQAACTFRYFLLNPTDPNNPTVYVQGVNDWGTVVGIADFGTSNKAFTHYSGGGQSYWRPSGAVSSGFIARNNKGVSAGGYGDSSGQSHAFLLKGSTVTQIVNPKALPGSTVIRGINNWNTAIGVYSGSDGKGHSFKRYSNGTFVDLPEYPYAISHWGHSTTAVAINDSGVIVGYYSDGTLIRSGTKHVQGFIYRNGQWATLDYPDPNTTQTWLLGISNAGVIIGSADFGPFLYANGTFKLIQAPNATYTYVYAIAPGGGLIAGYAALSDGLHGFTATCH